jgi:PAS domain S-box-containing protein
MTSQSFARVGKNGTNRGKPNACLPLRSAPILRTLIFILLLPFLGAAQPNEPKRVLILMQEDTSWPAFRLIDENVRATLRAGLPGGILVFSEHLDRSHFPDARIQAEQLSWIAKKYANSNLDLIINVGDVPTDLFPNAPLLFISADPRRKPPGSTRSASSHASVWVDLEAQKTLELAQRLQPGARRIVVIGDGLPSEYAILTRLRLMHPTNAGDTPVTYVTNPVISEICRRVSELGSDSIVLFTALTRDEHGHPLIPGEVISKIATASAAPVYVLTDMYVGTGAVGGYVASFAEVGKTGGQMGLRLLAGEHPQDVVTQNLYVFDGRQLHRWNIPESALPAGSVVLYRQPSLWESYKYYIVAIVLVCVAETLLILGLLWQRTTRRKFEHSLLERVTFEKMLSDLSATFINLPEEHIEVTLEKSLSSVADFLQLDRITVYRYSKESRHLRVSFSWRGEGIEHPQAVIGTSQLPWWSAHLLRGEALLLSDLKELPEEAFLEKEHLKRMGVVSVATIPLKAGNELFGAISFVSTKRSVQWNENLAERLRLLAEIFSNALSRERALDARFKHSAIVESSDDAIVSRDLDGIIVSWNAAAQRLYGYSEGEVVGELISMLIPSEQRDEESEFLQQLRAGQRVERQETVRIAKGGNRIAVSLTISSVKDSMGNVDGFSEIARDIADRKRAEHLLSESEGRFRLAANTAPAMIWMSGVDKRCTFFNQSWLHFTGRSTEQELGDGWAAGVHADDLERCLQIYSSSFDARVDFEMEYRLRRFDGEYRWLVDYGVPRFESDGNFCGYIGSCVDITERKTSEESLHTLTGRLITAQEEERARIARELHDDFSQRLALLGIGLGQLWKKLPNSDVEERASILEMLEGTREICSDLHSLSHQLHSSKLEHVGLVPALNGLCKDIAQKYKLAIHFNHFEASSDIPKDVALCLFRVAQGALGNVVKHSESKEAQVELRTDATGIALRIADQGRGFDPRAQNSAAGIGLIGMIERLRLVGGKLLVKSEPNRGTEILAEVPLAASLNKALARAQAAGR